LASPGRRAEMTTRRLLPGLGVGAFLLAAAAVAWAADPDGGKLTPRTLSAKLAAQPKGEDARKLADAVREWFGKGALRDPKVDGLEVAWAFETADPKDAPVVVSQDGTFILPLIRIGDTDVYAATFPFPDGAAMRWAYQVGGKRLNWDPKRRNAGQL